MAISLTETIKREASRDRDKPWQFPKGKSGNPLGRPKAHTQYSLLNAQALARVHTKESVATLVHYMRQRKSGPLAVKAAELILNRAWGVPAQDIALKADLTVSIAAIVQEARQRAILPLNSLQQPDLIEASNIEVSTNQDQAKPDMNESGAEIGESDTQTHLSENESKPSEPEPEPASQVIDIAT